MLARRNSSIATLPPGFILQQEIPPSPRALNRLFWLCREETYAPRKLSLALEKSAFYLTIIEEFSKSD